MDAPRDPHRDFSAPPKSVHDVLKIVSMTQTGRQLLERFLPLLHANRVRVESYPLNVVEKLRSILGEGQPVGASFIHDGRSGTIYIDPTSPIGVLAPFLVHEIVHSLDTLCPSSNASDGSRRPRPTHPVDAESHAFRVQYQFTQELRQRFEDYERFLKTQFPRARILHELLSEDEIATLYGTDESGPLKCG